MSDTDPTPTDGTELDEAHARVSSREALRFLTRAGRVLSGSLDPDRTLRRVVRLAVPRVACFATIDLARDDGLLERVAFAHVDPERQPLLERVEPFRPGPEGLLPLAQVLEEGRSILIEDVHADWPRVPEADVALERIRRLAGTSIIVVPLVSRGESFGTITFGSTRTDRFYRRTDLALAEELARTATLALENARLYQAAERAIRARDEVLAVVSHDLRNPVHRVKMAAELLLDTDQVKEGGRASVGIISRAVDSMTRLISDLLDVSRIEAGRLSLDAAPTPVSALLARLDEEFGHVARAEGREWQMRAPDGLPTLELDEHRIMQCLGNLIGNAIKFTPKGGSITIEGRARDDGGVDIGVCDTGPGMAPEQLAHVFDRFWQAGRGDKRGAGLGLAIAKGIAEAHGGRLRMESQAGEGTQAWLELPPPTG